jgi:hypothetical protein
LFVSPAACCWPGKLPTNLLLLLPVRLLLFAAPRPAIRPSLLPRLAVLPLAPVSLLLLPLLLPTTLLLLLPPLRGAILLQLLALLLLLLLLRLQFLCHLPLLHASCPALQRLLVGCLNLLLTLQASHNTTTLTLSC